MGLAPLSPWQAKQVWALAGVSSAIAAAEAAARARAMAMRVMERYSRVRRGAGKVGGDVSDVLVGQRRCLRLHGLVRALAAAVGGQRSAEVGRILSAQARHAVGRIHVVVVRNAVAAHAGVGLGAA